MDPLSGAASIISIVSLATQATGNVKKLQDFFKSLGNASTEVERIKKSLDVIITVLKRFQNDLTESNNDEEIVRHALVDCEDRIKAVTTSIEDIASTFEKSGKHTKLRASFRMVNRTKEIAVLESHLEKAKSTLLLALQSNLRKSLTTQTTLESELRPACCISQVSPLEGTVLHAPLTLDQRPSLHEQTALLTANLPQLVRTSVQEALNTHMEELLQSPPRSRPPENQLTSTVTPISNERPPQQTWKKKFSAQTMLGAMNIRTKYACEDTSGYEDEPTCSQYTLSRARLYFAPSKWLYHIGMSHAVDLTLTQSVYSGWQISLNCPRVQPDDSQVFKLCTEGDLPGLQALLAKGEASIHDINSWGFTPLHFAAAYHHPDICRFLIAHRANVHAKDWMDHHRTPFTRALTGMWWRHRDLRFYMSTYTSVIETLKTMLDAGFDIESFESDEFILLMSFHFDDMVHIHSVQHQREVGLPSRWVLNHLRPHFLNDTQTYDRLYWRIKIMDALSSPPEHGRINDILSCCNLDAIKLGIISWFARVWNADPCRYITGPEGTVKNFKDVLSLTGSFCFEVRIEKRLPHGTTPTRTAMRNSSSFIILRGLLKELGIAFDKFAAVEAPLIDDGWEADTLEMLLRDDYKPVEWFSNKECKLGNCGRRIFQHDWPPSDLDPDLDPLWQYRRDRIKRRLNPDGPFTEEESMKYKESYEYLQLRTETGFCDRHFKKFEEEQRADQAYHPGLIAIDL